MAEFMARDAAGDELADVEFSSAGVSDEEHGGPLDPRAAEVLRRHHVPFGRHRAHQITRDEAEAADLVVAMAPEHVARLRRIAPAAEVALMNSFNPDAASDGIADPWYGADEGFETTYADIDAAMPGLLDHLADAR